MQYSSDVEKVAYVVFVHMAATIKNVKKRKKSQFVLTKEFKTDWTKIVYIYIYTYIYTHM